MGIIFASFQSPGKMPSRKDSLNNMVRDGAICSAVSCSRRIEIPSDPVALFISSCLRDVKTIFTWISSSSRFILELKKDQKRLNSKDTVPWSVNTSDSFGLSTSRTRTQSGTFVITLYHDEWDKV